MYTFIVNPNARSGLGQVVWNDLEKILKRKNVPYQVFFTKYQKHATAIAKEITSGNEDHTLVALGGDGTVNEVINGIVNFEKTTFGYIPIGSSNDFARGLKLPKEPLLALHNILSCRCLHAMDIGVLSYRDKIRRFTVSSGMGFDADICHKAVVSRVKRVLNKLKLGKLTYICIALNRLILTSPCTVEITLDHKQTLRFPNTYFVVAMNNKYEGGGVKFCPNAKSNDRKLDIMVASNVPKWKVLYLMPLALFGLHVPFKGVNIYTCKHIDIHAEHPLPVHTDGEPIFLQKDVSMSLHPERLKVITRKKLS